MTLLSTYQSRKELIATNLQAMGVESADADEGLTTLANKILNIEPSVSGLDFTTSLELDVSDNNCVVNQSITFWCELKVSYDDDTLEDVDLSGVLTGALITFKNGNTILGTGITNNNGIAYYTHRFATAGNYTITASFDGTDNFDACTSNQSIVSCDSSLLAEFTGTTVTLGQYPGQYAQRLGTTGDVVVDWGDGTSSTINNPTTQLSHTYSDGLESHTVTFIGEVTDLYTCFSNCTGLISIVIPDSVTNLVGGCFSNCTGLASIVIPDSVSSIGKHCFNNCTSLLDYQLYWTNGAIPSSFRDYGDANSNAIFTIPAGETSNYINAGFQSTRLQERGSVSPVHDYSLSVVSNKDILSYADSESATVTATLTDNGVAVSGETLSYTVKHGSTTINSGTGTTDNNGQVSIIYNSTGVGDVTVEFDFESLLQEIFVVLDCVAYQPFESTTIPTRHSIRTRTGVTTEFATDWKTVGNYSLKASLGQWDWFSYDLIGSTDTDDIDSIRYCTVDVKTDNPVRLSLVQRKSDDTDYTTDYLDITESGTYTIERTYSEDILRIYIQIVNRQSNTATCYMDNIRFY